MFFELVLIGTTASGKSHIANVLANEFQAVILSLDSLCVYKEINIASAKPSKAELEKLQYFGVNLLSVKEHFNVALFMQEYKKAKDYAFKKKAPLIIVGGTSFYLKILQDGLSKQVPKSKEFPSNENIYQLLKEKDPSVRIEKNDSYRLQKWFSIYEYAKQIPSEFLKQTKQNGVLKDAEIYELVWEKDALRRRIALRTQTMLQSGLIEEAQGLFARFNPDLKALNCIGLKECKAYLNGEISLKELEFDINTHTAQLAKRQRTFNKKIPSICVNFETALKLLEEKMKKML